jgi:hypothetical protein
MIPIALSDIFTEADKKILSLVLWLAGTNKGTLQK